VGVHGQLALDDVAASAVWLVAPVEALQFAAVSVDVAAADVAALVDLDAAVDFVAAVVAAVVPVVPVAMQAPRTAVATTDAAPAATRDRAAGRRRRARFGMGCSFVSLMAPIIRDRR
jgi:hypothetical protein